MKVQHHLFVLISERKRYILVVRGKGNLTICISYLVLVLESSSHSNAENQKDPVDVRDVNLPKEFLRGVDYLHAGEATKCKSLLYD
jgi:hypothetical protein